MLDVINPVEWYHYVIAISLMLLPIAILIWIWKQAIKIKKIVGE